MIPRSLLFIFFFFVSFQGIAQEESQSKVAVEHVSAEHVSEEHVSAGNVALDNVTTEKTTITAPRQDVEVGRHVMGNVDAGSMILSLLAVLVAIVIAAWLLKKMQVGGTTVNGLKVITSLNLGAKEKVVVVQVGDKQLLLGVTGQQINLLDTLAEPIEIKSGVPIEISQTLARFSRNSTKKANSEKYS